MEILLKVIVGLFAGLFLFMGGTFLFDPAAASEQLALTAMDSHGLNTIRGDLAGLFLGSGILLVLGLVQKKSAWFLAVAVLMGTIAAGRLVGFAMDGSPTSATITALAVELIMVAVLVLASKKITSD